MKKFWVSAGPEFLSLQASLFRLYQRMVLAIPGFHELGSGTQRIMAFLHVWRYLFMAGIQGDYLEFGVYEGLTFELALRGAAKYYRKGSAGAPRFFAFDSFCGLPAPDPQRDSQFFHEAAYAATLTKFRKRIHSASRGWDVRIVPGFYDESLTPDLLSKHEIKKAAFVNIDCDLYQSTRSVLRFIAPLLQNGTVLYFDDWYFSRGVKAAGEEGACRDWLRDNSGISLSDYGNVGTMGKLFIVSVAGD